MTTTCPSAGALGVIETTIDDTPGEISKASACAIICACGGTSTVATARSGTAPPLTGSLTCTGCGSPSAPAGGFTYRYGSSTSTPSKSGAIGDGAMPCATEMRTMPAATTRAA